MTAVAAPTDFLSGQTCSDAHSASAGQDLTSPRATDGPMPKRRSPVGGMLPEPTMAATTPMAATSAQEPTSGSGHSPYEPQRATAAAGTDSPTGHTFHDAQERTAGGGTDGDGPVARERTNPLRPPLLDPSLSLASLLVDDLEALRIAEKNRLQSLTDPERFGLTDEHPDVQTLARIIAALWAVEKDAILHLNRTVRRHPLGAWAKAQKGIGEKTFARFLATLGGDPYINHNTGQPRTVSQLWAYAGHGDPTRRKRKGMTQNDLFALGNPDAKKRLYLIATTCLKAQGHYADVYYARRQQTEDRTHAADCIRCGPSGKPAPEGSPWSAAHQHADALRIVGKHILRDLWTEAKRIHEGEAS